MPGRTFIMVHLSSSSLSGWEKETTMRPEGASTEKKKRMWGNQGSEVLATYVKEHCRDVHMLIVTHCL